MALEAAGGGRERLTDCMVSPIFILGCQRSGTTLLCTILNRHPEVYVANELPWVTYDFITGARSDFPTMVTALAKGLRIPELPQLVAELAEPGPFEILETGLTGRARALGKSRWGLKDPRLTYFLPAFMQRYPESNVLHIVRDCRATSISLVEQAFNAANVYHAALLWRSEIEKQVSYALEYGDRVRRVRYEDLVTDPSFHVGEICKGLGITYTPQMLDERSHVTMTVNRSNVNARRPIDPAILERWKRKLSAKQQAVVETIAGDAMQSFGYEVTGKRVSLSSFERVLYDLHQLIMTNYWWQKRRWLTPIVDGFSDLVSRKPMIKQ